MCKWIGKGMKTTTTTTYNLMFTVLNLWVLVLRIFYLSKFYKFSIINIYSIIMRRNSKVFLIGYA